MRTRKPLPKGKDAEEELKRQRRNERRALRRAKKAAAERGEVYEEPSAASGGGAAATGGPWDVDPAMFNGVPNPEELKQMFAQAFADLGGTAGLVAWGKRYPKEFYAIWARICIPRTIGDGGGGGGGGGIEDVIAQLDSQER